MGIVEGVDFVVGGLGKLEGLEVGYYVKFMVFVDVVNDMMIV